MGEVLIKMSVLWTIAAIGAVCGLALPTTCPEYVTHYCACEITDQAKATPLRMCTYGTLEGIACKPCLNRQEDASCSSCPGSTCPVCAANESELLTLQRSMTPKSFKDLKDIGYITAGSTFMIAQNTSRANSSDEEYTSNDAVYVIDIQENFLSGYKGFDGMHENDTTEAGSLMPETGFYELSYHTTNYHTFGNSEGVGKGLTGSEEILAKVKDENLTSVREDFEIFGKYIPKSTQQQRKLTSMYTPDPVSFNGAVSKTSENSSGNAANSQSENQTFETRDDENNVKLAVHSNSELSREIEKVIPILNGKLWEVTEKEEMSEKAIEYLKTVNGNMRFETNVEEKSLSKSTPFGMVEDEEISTIESGGANSETGNHSFQTTIEEKSLASNKQMGMVQDEGIPMSASGGTNSENGNLSFQTTVEEKSLSSNKQMGMVQDEGISTSESGSTNPDNVNQGFQTTVEEKSLSSNKQMGIVQDEGISTSATGDASTENLNQSFQTTDEEKSLSNHKQLEKVTIEEISKSVTEETKLKDGNLSFSPQTNSYSHETMPTESFTSKRAAKEYKSEFMDDTASSSEDNSHSNERIEKLSTNAGNSENESSTKVDSSPLDMPTEYKSENVDISTSPRNSQSSKGETRNSWCKTDMDFLGGSLNCKHWTYKKECVVKCFNNYHYSGQNSKSFSCFRKKNVWEPKMVPCEEVPTEMEVKEVKATDDDVGMKITSTEESVTDDAVKTSTIFDESEFQPEELPINNGSEQTPN